MNGLWATVLVAGFADVVARQWNHGTVPFPLRVQGCGTGLARVQVCETKLCDDCSHVE